MSIGQNLKKIRNQRNLTQGQLADNAKLSLNQISRIERGSAKPELETIKKLAIALYCSSDELIFDDHEFISSDELRILFNAVEDLSEDKKEMIQDFIEAMIMKSDVEKWVNKTTKKEEKKALRTIIQNQHTPDACKVCGAEMKERELDELELNKNIEAVYQCTECDYKAIFTSKIHQ